jgi:hypothetical protein
MTINCQPPAHATPTEQGAWADKWHPSQVLEPTVTGLCHGCPAKTACADWALTFIDPITGTHVTGVWGGTTTEERQAIRRGKVITRKPPAPCGTRAAYERHRRVGETPCDECKAANTARNQARKKTTNAA